MQPGNPAVHKIYLLKERGREQECLALLKSILPKIKNPEVQQALSEIEIKILSAKKVRQEERLGDTIL